MINLSLNQLGENDRDSLEKTAVNFLEDF